MAAIFLSWVDFDLFFEDSHRVGGVALSLDLHKLTLLILEKIRMLENLLICILMFCLVEVVHIQLTLKGAKIVVLKIYG